MLKTLSKCLLVFSLLSCFTISASAQCTEAGDACAKNVPRLVRFAGVLKDAAGNPRTGTVGITFAIYSESTGGAPLWQETQNVHLDEQGHYAIMLGMTQITGLPAGLFASGDPRWLSVQAQLPDESERPRVLLVSVPYALQAANAETLGGLPPSAFVRVAPPPSNLSSPQAEAANPSALVTLGTAPVASSVQAANGSSTVAVPNSQTPDAKAAGNPAVSIPAANTSNVLYAEQFVGGVPDAIKACPALGCVIYAYSQMANRNLKTIDPGTKTITIYLGPYTYYVNQIVLRRDLKIIGMGSGITFLKSVNGNNPVVVVPQVAFGVATNVFLSGFRLIGSDGNSSEDAMFWDSSGNVDSGVWYSELQDIAIIGFAGIGIHLRGTSADFSGMTQFVQFNRVVVWRSKGGGNGLRIEGAAYELSFNDCQFDGTAPGDGTNIFLGAFPPSPFAVPTNISFSRLTTQLAATAVQIDGGWAVSFYSPHHESLWGVYWVTENTGAGLRGLTISDAGFQSSGVNGGAGYLLNVATPSATGIRFVHNHIMGPADAVVLATQGASIVYEDNEFFGGTSLPGTSGITLQLAPSSTIAINGARTVGLTSSTTPITTIQSSLGAGEAATFFTINGPVTFASGGNINLLGATTLVVNGSITFAVSDLGTTPSWVPISQWTASP
ncbi:MAG: hypothetical protein WBQ68_04955 [Terriglobales bacterium]